MVFISADHGDRYTWLKTWGNVPSESPVGRALSGNNSCGQVHGALRVAALVSSAQTREKGSGTGSALFRHMDWVSLERCGFILRERMVKKGDRQISMNFKNN